MHRRTLVLATFTALGSAVLASCGFKLRAAQPMAFTSIAITPENSAGVAGDLARYFGNMKRPAVTPKGQTPPEVILDILQELRQKTVVGVNASGLVREFQLRLQLRFRLRTPGGEELLAPTQLEQTRDISFNESVVLAKESEEALLYRDMQADILQQVLRRLAAVKSIPVPAPTPPLTTPGEAP
jgi:LPS-assembly lipoprotein